MFQISAAFRSRIGKLGKGLGIVLGAWFWAAFVCMFLEKRYPGLHPFAMWTFRFYFGLFIAFGGAIVIVGPAFTLPRSFSNSLKNRPAHGSSRI